MTTKKHELMGNRKLLNISVKEFIGDYVYRIDLDADYQREKIWTPKQQQLLLDSILRDIDIPKIYIVKVEGNKQFEYECIDGKQRMTALLRFFKPDPGEEHSLKVRHYEKEYTYEEFKKTHPTDAKKIEDYALSFTIYEPLDDEYVREIFRRLQLGIRLNSGELLKTRTGTIRDFVYKEIGNSGPFFRITNLSEKRFSRPFTLSQICVNSFAKAKPNGEFVRARLQDIEDFFEENHDLNKDDENLDRIRKVLKEIDKAFKKKGSMISSRAIAVTAYLFVEELFVNKRNNLIPLFAKCFFGLLEEINHNMELLSKYEKPANSTVMEEFQKYVLQASVEGYSIKRRHEFLKKVFDYYQDKKTKGKIIGSK
ncbi:MAG: DUF262 domain-containing protein [Candidatus Omnitrophica bacterium]|nr:DUF262 domain-containing protein [Candidatus Omnitrophota bacterium]